MKTAETPAAILVVDHRQKRKRGVKKNPAADADESGEKPDDRSGYESKHRGRAFDVFLTAAFRGKEPHRGIDQNVSDVAAARSLP